MENEYPNYPWLHFVDHATQWKKLIESTPNWGDYMIEWTPYGSYRCLRKIKND